ncbi:MAG: hypothetical protein WC098_04650 [Bacteroidales bacterium]
MIPDIENTVFSTVATALRDEFDGIFVAGEQVAAPSTFPAVMLVETDNSTYQRTLDSSGLAISRNALHINRVEKHVNHASLREQVVKRKMNSRRWL